MKKKAVVLGCGLVGATIARDMAADADFDVTVVDVNADNLKKLAGVPRLGTKTVDLSNRDKFGHAIADADVVLVRCPAVSDSKPSAPSSNAASRTRTFRSCPRRRWTSMHSLGSASHRDRRLRGIAGIVEPRGPLGRRDGHRRNAEIYVGGLPKVRHWPFQYKAPFSPYDVIEEYTRPARLVEHGAVVVKPALSEPESMGDFPGVGSLEAFNTDGLRSLLITVTVPNMKEKTLRYPGHIELMCAFRETGLFSDTPIDVRGTQVVPREVTSRLLFPLWTYKDGEEEFTVLRVVAEGSVGGQRVRHLYDLYDETDRATGLSSMARTTGFPCAIFARMLARREFADAGVFPPELLARDAKIYEHVLDCLRQRRDPADNLNPADRGAPTYGEALHARYRREDHDTDIQRFPVAATTTSPPLP